jgi:hypothetical protein
VPFCRGISEADGFLRAKHVLECAARRQLVGSPLPHEFVAPLRPPEAQWEFSFIDDDGGRQTRLEVTSANGTFPGEHALALARACAA